MRAGAGEPRGDGVRLGDEPHDLHVHVAERPAEGRYPVPRPGRQRGRVELVDDVEAAGVHHLVDEAPDDCPVVLDRTVHQFRGGGPYLLSV